MVYSWKEVYDEDIIKYPNDYYTFTIDKFECSMKRSSGGYWCGYVRLPKEHPFFGLRMEDIAIDVHGGITYSDSSGWIGFDCAHYNDITPIVEEHMPYREGSIDIFCRQYRNYQFGYNEIESIISQLI